MQTDEKIPPFVFNQDQLEELIAKENPDEMGMLDLIYMLEILNQREMAGSPN